MKTSTRSILAGAALAAGLFATNGASAQPQLRNCLDTMQGMPEFSRFVGAVVRSHLVNELRAANQITIFAPTNTAAAAVNQLLIDRVFPIDSTRTADPVLSLAAIGVHVVTNNVPAASLTNGRSIVTSGGTPLTVTVAAGPPPVTTITAVNGVVATVALPGTACSNGMIYPIDKVLFR